MSKAGNRTARFLSPRLTRSYRVFLGTGLLAAAVFCALGMPALAQYPAPSRGASPELAARLKECRELVHSGNIDEAIQQLNDLAKSDPDCVDVYEALGISYLRQGDCAKAESVLKGSYDGPGERKHSQQFGKCPLPAGQSR